MTKYLTHQQAKRFYDGFGKKQDWQRIYESPAIARLVEQGAFSEARRILELGCGTGAFALELLERHLPDDATYLGLDISETMVGLATERLAAHAGRAEVRRSEGAMRIDSPAGSCDRFVSNYVADLLAPAEIHELTDEAHRVLVPGGRACLLSLTHGTGAFSRALTWAWKRVHRLSPRLMGGCRPVDLLEFLPEERWEIGHCSVLTALGLASQVVVAVRR